MQLTYAIKFVSDMEAATAFYRDKLGLRLKFESPFWTEFSTGETTLALHPASDENPAGTVQLGFRAEDLERFYGERDRVGVEFTSPPTPLHGAVIGRFRDSEGAECSVSG